MKCVSLEFNFNWENPKPITCIYIIKYYLYIEHLA